ncbi:MAG: DUF58 domain-containing protein [Spirochaetia bacterium]|jgi:uncharacterized protein (DUF58 family)|nr:DUF58 domain-containing protein [Spirochaetia bacterium]
MKPGPTLCAAALLWLVLGAAAYFFPAAGVLWTIFAAALLPFIVLDALYLVLLTDRLQARRSVSAAQALGETGKVTLEISPSGKGFQPASIRIFDLYPDSMGCSAFSAAADKKLVAAGVFAFEYTVLPLRRGPWEFRGLHLLLGSPLRFWRLKVLHPCRTSGRTYPDFKKLSSQAGLDIRGLTEQSGIKNIRKRGQGLEFESLREYQSGDPARSIDWRATSRRQKPIVREYREERDQQLLFLLDSGYRLNRRDGEYTQFDSALNAVLLLSWVALKHGDSVAVGTFGTEERWLPMRKGLGALTGILNGLYDLQSSPLPSSPFSALENALARLRRRSLIVLASNFREEDGESLSWILPHIKKRHLLLLVSFRETDALRIAHREPSGPEQTLETAAAFSYLASRRRLYTGWEHLGLLTLETSPEEISPALINRYLSLKRSGRL